MTTWTHTCSFNGKTVTMSSADKSCALCNTTYGDEVVKLISSLAPELPGDREKQIPMLFKAFKRNKDE